MSETVKGEIVRREPNAQMMEQVPNVAPIVAPTENYQIGFAGIAERAFSPNEMAILREPIDPNDVEIKPDGIVFLPGVFYRSRLNRAFGPGAWAVAPRGPARRLPAQGGELVFFHAVLFVHGRFVSEAIGDCKYWPSNASMTYADAYEGAQTAALSRCCKSIMPGVEVMWEKGWRDEWQAKYCESYMDDGKRKWQRKPSSRISKLSPSATPSTPSRGAGAAATAPTAANGASQSAPSVPPAPASPTTAPAADSRATDAQLDALEKCAFEEMKFTHDYAGRWLFTNFQTRDPSALTSMNADKAIALLRQHGPLKGQS